MKLNFDIVKNNPHTIFALFIVFSIFAGLTCSFAANADLSTSDNAGPILDQNNNFVMSVPLTGGTGYHWEVSPDSYGVTLTDSYFVENHPGAAGSSGTYYFHFNVNDGNEGDFYAKIVLVSPTGDIVKEVDSNMLN